jgi:hypothetical protein
MDPHGRLGFWVMDAQIAGLKIKAFNRLKCRIWRAQNLQAYSPFPSFSY